jgi:hypothetical protein
MTTEIFRNTIFESPEAFHDVRYVIFDEIHYLDDIERGTVWEESIIFAPEHIRILCLSATGAQPRAAGPLDPLDPPQPAAPRDRRAEAAGPAQAPALRARASGSST